VLIEAFTDLATRLSDIFMLSSKRDRLVMRIMFDESLKSVLLPEPSYDRFSFLAYGLGPFLSRLSAVDAKALTTFVDDALAKVDSEDTRCTPLIDFADQLNKRSKGASERRARWARKRSAEQQDVDVKKSKADDGDEDEGDDDAMEQDDTIETADDDAETTADDHTLDDGPVETAERSRSRRK
jgi:cohesin complex subunit SA-1/2